MEVREYQKKFEEDVKDLYVELQEYINKIDRYNLNFTSSEYRQKYFEYTKNYCEKFQGKIFVAVENNKVIGLVSGYIQSYDEFDFLNYQCPKKGIVLDLIVTQNCRSNGVGQLLLKSMEDYFKNIGCQFVQLDVFGYNETAKKFYFNNEYEERMITLFKEI